MVNSLYRPESQFLLHAFNDVYRSPEQALKYKMALCIAVFESQRRAAIIAQEIAARIQARRVAEAAEAAQRACFSYIQNRFGTAIALLHHFRWDLRSCSPGERDYIMRCAERVRSLTFTRCRLPANFGKIIAEVFPRLEQLNVRHTNFSYEDWCELARSSIRIDVRGSRFDSYMQRERSW